MWDVINTDWMFRLPVIIEANYLTRQVGKDGGDVSHSLFEAPRLDDSLRANSDLPTTPPRRTPVYACRFDEPSTKIHREPHR